ncbi:MAG: hypothetical protein D8M59_14905 [Planctomycetes bacterium]|nr:hypothetical protein [Planctomycetota bacterium]NOG55018.1 hypothetical protein [Planctomycetota bacterium]
MHGCGGCRAFLTRCLAVVPALVCLTLVFCAGCGSDADSPKTVSEVAASLAKAMVGGFDYNGRHVSAERFDPLTSELFEVRVSGGDQVLFASRARIRVDTGRNVMWLELSGVTVARPDETGNGGGLWWTSDSMTLDPVSLGDLAADVTSGEKSRPSK